MWKHGHRTKRNKESINQNIYDLSTPVIVMFYALHTSLLELQQLCIKKGIRITFTLLKSSLVTQGRNLCVSAFLESNCTHMLFVDSDIYFRAESIIKMIDQR